jgi:hypothetical protein
MTPQLTNVRRGVGKKGMGKAGWLRFFAYTIFIFCERGAFKAQVHCNQAVECDSSAWLHTSTTQQSASVQRGVGRIGVGKAGHSCILPHVFFQKFYNKGSFKAQVDCNQAFESNCPPVAHLNKITINKYVEVHGKDWPGEGRATAFCHMLFIEKIATGGGLGTLQFQSGG